MASQLEIRVLGELQVVRGGKLAALPASKKTRALLGYLVVTAKAQTRQRLCDFLWDGPDDPRALLRWSLTKLRPLVDDRATTRLAAGREHVGFEPHGVEIDLVRAREEADLAGTPTTDGLRRAAALFRGELLEGLDLPECYRYHEWCIAEREAARRMRAAVLAALAERLAGDPEEALVHARARVAIDPLAEAGHIAVMDLLARLGRPREALKQYESCRRILDAQLGRTPSKELEAARSLLGRPGAPSMRPPPAAAPPAAPPASARADAASQRPTVLVARAQEQATIDRALHEANAGAPGGVLLFAGEPGIGKTRLLAEVAARAAAVGGTALLGRAFEAEMIRPYGAWIDLLRSAVRGAVDHALRGDLAPLLPELGAPSGEPDKNRLFHAVGALLRDRAGAAPLAVLVDDVQWLDEGSVALLHYLARELAGAPVLFACAARDAEIDANRPLQAMLRGLTRERRLRRVDLAPLDAEATAALVKSVDSRADAAQVFADGGGNPLFSIELARALAEGDVGGASRSLDALIAERLSRLDERAGDVLPWIAALGHAFSIETVATIAARAPDDLLAAIEELERHGVLRVVVSAPEETGYDFAHDLVRRSAYRAMSEPRRRWVHLQIARRLGASPDAQGALAGDVAHHAAIGGDSELAARAYLAAGERSLRLFALADASRLAGAGLQHGRRIASGAGIRLQLELLAVQVHSNQWLQRPQELEAELARIAERAGRMGMHAEVTRSFYLASFVRHARGDLAGAGASTRKAEEAGRAADVHTRQAQLANTARCLALIERDLTHAERLFRELESLGPPPEGRADFEIALGRGLLHAFKGEDDRAAPLLERAIELASAGTEAFDPWIECSAATRLARMALEAGRPGETVERCLAMKPLVEKLSEGSEAPFALALLGLARLALGEPGAREDVHAAVAKLRDVDSKAHLAYALAGLADDDLVAGRPADALRCAREALDASEAVGQASEAAVARALLARVALEQGDRAGALRWLEACAPDMGKPLTLSARAREAVTRAREAAGPP